MPVDTSLTLRDLILRVSEHVGVASWPADGSSEVGIPADGSLARLKVVRCINDGIKRMVRDYPRWTALLADIQITLTPDGSGTDNIDNDPNRYIVPYAVEASPMGQWTAYTPDNTWRGDLLVRPPSQLRSLLHTQALITGGVPRLVAIDTLRPADRQRGQRAGLEILVWPMPDQEYLVEGDAKVMPAPLINLDDRPLFSAAHDMTIVAAALMVWHSQNPDLQTRQQYMQEYKEALGASIQVDNLQQPQQLGTNMCPTDPLSAGLAGSSFSSVTAYITSSGEIPLV